MSKQWQEYSDKYLTLTTREQYLVFLSGLVAIFFIVFYVFIDTQMIENKKSAQQVMRLKSSNQSLQLSTLETQAALQRDPNEDIRKKITQYETKSIKVDEKLLTLTSDLISPIQMRYALLDLLKLEKGVSLLSFELMGAQPLLTTEPAKDTAAISAIVKSTSRDTKPDLGLNLYRHGIKIKLTGLSLIHI